MNTVGRGRAYMLAYFFGGGGAFPLGASLGLQAKGLPSGAKQLPLTAPCGDVKLQSCPTFSALQASSASCDGLRGCWPSAGGAPDDRCLHGVARMWRKSGDA